MGYPCKELLGGIQVIVVWNIVEIVYISALQVYMMQ